MGKIVSNFFIAFDGVVEAPDQWHFPYFDDDMGRIVGEGMSSTRAFLLGRRLYDEWSQYWPAQGPEVPFSSFINEVPKYVITHRPLGDDRDHQERRRPHRHLTTSHRSGIGRRQPAPAAFSCLSRAR